MKIPRKVYSGPEYTGNSIDHVCRLLSKTGTQYTSVAITRTGLDNEKLPDGTVSKVKKLFLNGRARVGECEKGTGLKVSGLLLHTCDDR